MEKGITVFLTNLAIEALKPVEDRYHCICHIFGNHMVGVVTCDMRHVRCDM